MTDDLAERVQQAVVHSLNAADPNVIVIPAWRPNGMLDLTVISTAFASQSAEERERQIWSVLRAFDAQDLVRMTYSLLVTPSEAAALSADPLDPDSFEDA